MLDCSPFHVAKQKYWWRSLTVAYIMRPNEPTRQLIMKHRQDKDMMFDYNHDQCVSVYVRRGDKHLEMKIIEDESVFFETAKKLQSHFKNATEHGVMFVGSEDPGVLDHAITWGQKNNWDIRYTNLFDRRAVSTGLNNDQQQEARQADTPGAESVG